MISVIFVLSWVIYIASMYVFVNNQWWLLPVWLVSGYVVGWIVVVLTLFIHLPFMKRIAPDNRYKYYVTRSVGLFVNVFVLRLKIQIEGIKHIPETGMLTLYANHKSYADPFIIMRFMKRPITFTPKMSVYKAFFIGKWLSTMGAFPIDRSSDRNTARAMVDAIKIVKQGMAMAIFPEGGIKDRDDEQMVAMRAGAYKLAMKAGADLLPVRIIGSTEIKRRAPFRRTKIRVVIMPLIRYEKIKHMTTNEVADLLFTMINKTK